MTRTRRYLFCALFFLALFVLPGGYVECHRGDWGRVYYPVGYWIEPVYPVYPVYVEPIWYW
jgi:hypothetical protein